MGLIRAIARPLLAAPFIVGGINQLRNPKTMASSARPVVDKIAKETGLPDDPELFVTANGAAMIAAGTGLATGILRKPAAAVLIGSLIPTALAGHAFWEEQDPQQRHQRMIGFATDAGLLGGLILSLIDTEGKPGLLYRTKLAGESVGRAAEHTTREARHMAKAAKREARSALALAKRDAKLAMLQAKDAVT